MMNMTIGDLKDRIKDLPDDMSVIIPVITEDDVNRILAFRHVRTAGILKCEYEEENDKTVLCLNGATDDLDISSQVEQSHCDPSIECEQVLF